MKYYRLKAIDGAPAFSRQWDHMFGIVVAARSAAHARKIASNRAKDEARYGGNPWLDPRQTKCQEMKPPKSAGVILEDVLWS